ncbi:unnamed protein product, partial [Trichogramma brassicae]
MVPRHQEVLRRGDTRRKECVQLGSVGQHPRRSTPFARTRLLAENNRQLLLGKSARLHHGRRSRVLRKSQQEFHRGQYWARSCGTLCMTRSCASTSMAMFVSSVSRGRHRSGGCRQASMADRTRSKRCDSTGARSAPGSQLTKRLTTRRRLCSSQAAGKKWKPSPSR